MFEEFKKSMKSEFDMPASGEMRYFLGVKVIQSTKEIFISPRKYAKQILERSKMAQFETQLSLDQNLSKEDLSETAYANCIGKWLVV